MRRALIIALDWLCGALGHPSYRVCCWITEHPWWGDDLARRLKRERKGRR